ncbi:hypothetical protein OSTOST_08717, partial [Ostertagia ostertagi]
MYNPDFSAFRKYLNDVDWFVDAKYEIFLAVLHHAMDLFIPYKRHSRPVSKLPPYLSSMSRRRDHLWNSAIDSQSSADWQRYQLFDKRYTNKLNKYYTYVEKKLLSKGGVKAFYSILNSRLSSQPCVGTLSDNSRRAITNQSKSELLADAFVKTFVSPHPTKLTLPNSKFVSSDPAPWFYKEDIADMLLDWSSSAATNPDDLPYLVVKHCIHEITDDIKIYKETCEDGADIHLQTAIDK